MITTADDLRACFRLLLGRELNEAEYEWHKWRIGQPLSALVDSVMGSEEFASLHRQKNRGDISVAQCDGWLMYASPNDVYGGKGILRNGKYEPHVSSVFRSRLRPGFQVLDIGANIGYYSLLAATVVGPSGNVIAVEPNPRNVRMLLASARLNHFENLQVLQIAAGREWGVLVFYTDGSQGSVRKPVDGDAILEAETAGAARLDDILKGRRIDVIKIDVEGYEHEALEGCLETIRAHRPLIFSEFQPASFVGSPEEYLRFLENEGYRFSILREEGPAFCTRAAVMEHCAASGSDHIDLLLEPCF